MANETPPFQRSSSQYNKTLSYFAQLVRLNRIHTPNINNTRNKLYFSFGGIPQLFFSIFLNQPDPMQSATRFDVNSMSLKMDVAYTLSV